ncbi:MAG: hypothetical protein KF813_05660 [Trueperaceae bacterium]|nr:hypothetical protein [Trueperaceae bacterium]
MLVSNGPGELYTWVRPVLREIRRRLPDAHASIALIPCQFACGAEAEIAATFEPDVLTTPAQFLRAAATGSAPSELKEVPSTGGAVIGLGGNGALAVKLGRNLGLPAFRYSFEPVWLRGLEALLLPDAGTQQRAVRGGAPTERTAVVGNLVADAVEQAEPLPERGSPHVLLFSGSRDAFAVHLIPFMIALVDRLGPNLPGARFVWPVSSLLSEQTLAAGIAGTHAATLGGVGGVREADAVITPGGYRLELAPEADRYAHMVSADIAVTIPGTNTLELGVAGVPTVVMLPLNRPEVIPLEGLGHWLGVVPIVGKYLKRYAVRLFVQGLKVPVSLPNRIAKEELFDEVKGVVSPDLVAEHVMRLLGDPRRLADVRARLGETMPKPGAATQLLDAVLARAAEGGR